LAYRIDEAPMQLVLSDDQALLAEGARSFVSRSCPTSRLRRLRDDATGFDPELWRQIAELGWTRAPFAEEHGGLGLGIAGAVCITEALGRGLATEPYLSTVLLGGECVAIGGSAEQRAALLEPMLAGELHLALAHQERGARFDPFEVTARAEPREDGFRLSGEKTQVLGGHVAGALIVVARTSGSARDRDGLTLLVVRRDAPGVEIVRQRRVDAAPVALVRLRDVELPRTALLGEVDGGAPILEAVLDRATVALAAEMLGSMTEALERTLQYLKERMQFGVVIGSFQALKHRAARMFIEVELCRSAVMAAARALDEGRKDARELVSVAKARANDAFLLIANEAIQMHGGIGMTDEHDIGFFLKRARAAEMTFGDAAYHRNRFAELRGF
jgi:alkylation response protein AidB-like acyl-CoA dehydrogenase